MLKKCEMGTQTLWQEKQEVTQSLLLGMFAFAGLMTALDPVPETQV